MLKADVDCLCEAFKSSAQFGVVFKITKLLPFLTVHVSYLSSLSFSAFFFFLLFGKFCPVWLLGKLGLLEFQQEIFVVVIDGSFVFS